MKFSAMWKKAAKAVKKAAKKVTTKKGKKSRAREGSAAVGCFPIYI